MKNRRKKSSSDSFNILRRIEKKYKSIVKQIPDELSWIMTIYDPHILFDEITDKKKSGDLRYCAWRLSPIYKIFNQ